MQREVSLVVSPYTPRQAARLFLLDRLLNRVEDAQNDLDSGAKMQFATQDAEGKRTTLMSLDTDYIDIWKHRAFSLYYDEIRIDPGMREGAHTIFQTYDAARQRRQTPVSVLSEMWNRE